MSDTKWRDFDEGKFERLDVTRMGDTQRRFVRGHAIIQDDLPIRRCQYCKLAARSLTEFQCRSCGAPLIGAGNP